jgi:hypothetical protein
LFFIVCSGFAYQPQRLAGNFSLPTCRSGSNFESIMDSAGANPAPGMARRFARRLAAMVRAARKLHARRY